MSLIKTIGQKTWDQHVVTLLRSVREASSASGEGAPRAAVDTGSGISRADLARLTKLRPNTVGSVIDEMVRAGWLTQLPGLVEPAGRGRPPVRVQMDAQTCHLVGLALSPQRLQAVRVNLLGQSLGKTQERSVSGPAEIAEQAAAFVSEFVNEQTLAVGVSSPGLVDDANMRLLFGSAAPDTPGLSLNGIIQAAGELPVALENDMHALGDRWRLSTPPNGEETVVLISLADGAVGASIMAGGGAADAGCVRAGNEVGHMQVHSAEHSVPRCYCGQPRCVERVFSSAMASRLEGADRQLLTVLQELLDSGITGNELYKTSQKHSQESTSSGAWILGRVAETVGNVVNLIRPHRVVWVYEGQVSRIASVLTPVLSQAVSEGVLPVLRERVCFETWCPQADGQTSCAAVTAGHLGIAMLTGQRVPVSGFVSLRT